MSKMPYIKIYPDFIEILRELDNGAKGRLFMAIMEYANDMQPDDLTGAERVAFVAIKNQIDRDAAAYKANADKQRENGKKGGRPKKPIGFSENPKNPSVFLETQKSHNKEEEKDKDKEKEKEDKDIAASAAIQKKATGSAAAQSPFGMPKEEATIQGTSTLQGRGGAHFDMTSFADPQIKLVFSAWDKANGRLCTQAESAELVDLVEQHGADRVLYAIAQCVDNNAVKLSYAKAVLKGSKKVLSSKAKDSKKSSKFDFLYQDT